MAITTQHAPGTFCWPELTTTDQNGAKKFYTTLFGWTVDDSDLGGGEVYTTLKLKDASVGALCGMREEQRAQGMPPSWGSYVAVESADRAAVRAKELGGTLLMEPSDVMDIGRMAVIQDPTGAVLCVWQAKKHAGAGVLNEPGALCWTELMTIDTAKAETFYAGLFSWKTETMKTPEMTYTIFKRGDALAGGMMQITPKMGPMPSNWLVYFAVTDCDGIVAKAKGMGAKTAVPATDIPDIGRFAVLADPQGAHFAILQPM